MNNTSPRSFPFIRIIIISSSILITGLITILLIPPPHYKDGFKNLTDIEAYAKTLDENTKMDTENSIKPDFTSYYKTLAPTWKKSITAKCKRLLTFVKLAKPPLWSASFFKYQLETLAKNRQAKGKGNFIGKITPTLQSKIVIFGNIQGAFHSLTRCLKKLKELGIITEDLKVSTPDSFIIFMGNVIDRSPFTMETLSVAMKLLQQNPDNVIYLRGDHEANNYWQEHTLKTELQIRAAHLAKGTIPLVDQVNAFFDTLPLAGYIAIPGSDTNVIRLSDSVRGKNELLNEQQYAKFLTSKASGPYTCSPVPGEAGDGPLDIKVIFEGEKKRESYQPHDGLRLLAPDMGATAWTLLSCPTTVYQKAIKFVHDAFVIITAAQSLDDWKITLYNRNVQSQDPFKATTFYLLSGVEESGKNAKTITAPQQTGKEQQTTSDKNTTPPAHNQQPKTPTNQKTETQEPLQTPPPPPFPQQEITSETTHQTTPGYQQNNTLTIIEHAQQLAHEAEALATELKELTNQAPTISQPPKQEHSPTPTSAFEPEPAPE